MKARKQNKEPRQRKQDQAEPVQSPDPELMTPLQVARYFNVKVKRVRNWERKRYLTPVVNGKGERVYMTLEVEHLAAMYGR
jgi:hypothetical protein